MLVGSFADFWIGICLPQELGLGDIVLVLKGVERLHEGQKIFLRSGLECDLSAALDHGIAYL